MIQVHIWVPNLFEFKGGIQTYLKDMIRVLNNISNFYEFLIVDKLDKAISQNEEIKKYNKLNYRFCGSDNSIVGNFRFGLILVSQLLKSKPDLIICSHINFSPVAYIVQKIFKIPYWIIVYGVDAWAIKGILKAKALHDAQKIVSIGDYTKLKLIQEQGLIPDIVDLLPVTFDADRFYISPKKSYLLNKYELSITQPVILTVSRLDSAERYKGYDQIIKALPQIKTEVPDVHYILVGKGNDKSRIEKLIHDLNLEACVTLTGFIPDEELCDHYNLCDVFAMPSKGEGFGIVYLEALACGKPTLGGNQDGAIDALCQGELGALVDPDNIDEIAHTLVQILQGTYPHPLMYQPQALRQKVIEVYGFQAFQDKLLGLLQTTDLVN